MPRDYDESMVLPRYLWRNYGHLFSADEQRAVMVIVVAASISTSSKSRPAAATYVMAAVMLETPETDALLADGHERFLRCVSERLLRDHRASIVINRCPRCSYIVASPAARQCLWCHYDWHPI